MRPVFAWPLCALIWLWGLSAPTRADDTLPEERVMLEIDAPGRSLFRMAVAPFRGAGKEAASAAGVLRSDFGLVSLFDVLDPRGLPAVPSEEALATVQRAPWRAVGAQGVIKGGIKRQGPRFVVEAHFFQLSAAEDKPALSRVYRGSATQLRGFMHRFANEVLKVLTGKPGAFGTKLAFARKLGVGRKEVFVGDFDGHRVRRVSNGSGVNMLPSFGPGGLWWTRMYRSRVFITHRRANSKPVVMSGGLDMAPVYCGGRIFFVSNRDGNSEIYSAKIDGSDTKRITSHPGIDVSPNCGPGGRIAFVSNRHGTPQIFVMNGDGTGVRRVTYRGSYNQTPSWCGDPKNPLIAFTGRTGGSMDIYTVNVETQAYTRLTQAQGINKDPAFSADCRMVSFWSSRGGIYISSPEGLNQQMVIPGIAETVRWSR